MVFVGNEDHNWHWLSKELNLHHISDIQAARDTFAVNLCAVAALTWVLYDLILCFEQEVSLVWWRWREHKGRHARRIYVIVRYFSILSLAWYVGVNTRQDLSHSFCQVWHYIVLINTAVITLLPDVIVIIRINAVYGWDHTTLLICTSLFLIQVITNVGIGALAISGARHPSISPQTLGCPLGKSKYHSVITLAALIPSVAAQGIYLLLMLLKFIHVLQDLDSNGKASAESLLQVRRLVPTMIAFVSNGSCYFFIAIMTKVVNAIVMVSVERPLRGIGVPIMMALYPVLIGRTYVSMVAYLHAEPDDTTGGDQDMMIVSSPSTLIRPRIESGQITFAVRSSFDPEPDEEESLRNHRNNRHIDHSLEII